MNRIIAGGTGFIGQRLVKHWLSQGITVTVIGRDEARITKIFGHHVTALTWEQFSHYGSDHLRQAELIINLSGANIGEKRWSQQRKNILLSSRLSATQLIVNLCAQLGKEAPTLFNASAVGIYGTQSPTTDTLPAAFTEDSIINYQHYPDFATEITRKWEALLEPAITRGVRVVKLRFAVVLDKNGGALQQIARPFHFGLGGPIASGQQPFPWIHYEDVQHAIDFLITQHNIVGAVNLVSPQGITQETFARAIGKAMHRPSFISTPGIILKCLFGEMANTLLLKGQHVQPKRLLEAGFKFSYPDIDKALLAIFTSSATYP